MGSDDLRFDVRLVERMLASGKLSREEYQKYLDRLPDLSSQAVRVDPGLDASPGSVPTEGPPSLNPRKK